MLTTAELRRRLTLENTQMSGSRSLDVLEARTLRSRPGTAATGAVPGQPR